MSELLDQARSYIQHASEPLAEVLGIEKLSENAPNIVASALFFWAVQYIGAPILSNLLVPKSYGRLRGKRAKNNWCGTLINSSTLLFDMRVGIYVS